MLVGRSPWAMREAKTMTLPMITHTAPIRSDICSRHVSSFSQLHLKICRGTGLYSILVMNFGERTFLCELG